MEKMTNLAIVIAILTTGFLLAGGSLWGVRESHIDPLEETSDIDVHEEKNQAKIFGAYILITLIVFFSTDDFIFESLSLLALAFVVFMFCMHASTAFASKLSSINNRNFQITVALVYPLVLSYYFIKNTTFLSIEMFLGNITTVWRYFRNQLERNDPGETSSNESADR